MSKMPLAWHGQCVDNAARTLAEKKAAVANQQREIDREEALLEFRKRQLSAAVSRGLDGYDPDRFLVARKKVS
jgi:hypothetical protein